MSRRTSSGAVRPVLALLVAAITAATTWALARFAVGTASGQRLDQLTLSGAQSHEGQLAELTAFAVDTVSVPVVAGLLALSALLVVLRRRAGLLLPLALLVVGANLTTQVIKHLLVTRAALGPGIDITPNSFPSGHTTLAASAAIALVLASGPARGIVAILGVVWTAGTGVGTLVVGWHRPSDVVGAILVVATWTFLVLAADGAHTLRRRSRAARAPGRGRRRAGGPAGPEPDSSGRSRPGASDRTIAIVLGLAAVAALVAGVMAFTGLELPLVLGSVDQQQTSFLATTAVISASVASWLALVLTLRTPE